MNLNDILIDIKEIGKDSKLSIPIMKIGYEDKNLYIQFMNKRIIVFHNVSKNTWNEFKTSNSLDSYYLNFIENCYECEEV